MNYGCDAHRKRFKWYRRYLQKPFVPRKRFRWYRILVSPMAWGYSLTPNPQQACHGISIRPSLGDKGFPTHDTNLGKAVLKVKHSFARVQNSRARRTLRACPCQAKMKKAPQKTEVLFLEWEQRESNPRPSACKADALNQLSYAPKLFAPEPGLEPGTL